MTTPQPDFPEAGAELVARIRQDRPDLDTLSNEELWAHARDLTIVALPG